MNSSLAQYLFNKETLYKTPNLQLKPIDSSVEIKEVIVEKQEVSQKPVISEQVPPEIVNIPIATETLPSALILKHKVLILSESFSDGEKAFLGKVLGAIGLNLNQIDLVELNKIKHLDYQAFISQKVTNKFISFGVGLGKMNWNLLLTPYMIRNIEGIDFLLCEDLKTVESDVNLKKSLWAALQKMFL